MTLHRFPSSVERARSALERAAHRCRRAQERYAVAQAELARAHKDHMAAIAAVAHAADTRTVSDAGAEGKLHEFGNGRGPIG